MARHLKEVPAARPSRPLKRLVKPPAGDFGANTGALRARSS